MSRERKRPHGRGVWSPARRFGWRLGCWLFNFCIGPFLTKLEDGTVQASMTRIAVAGFSVAVIVRLLPVKAADGGYSVPVIGWPDAFLAFVILFALPIDGALTALARRNPEKLVELLLARMGVGAVAPAAAGFERHEWTTGDPDEGVI